MIKNFTDHRERRGTDKYDKEYERFLKRNFDQIGEKHLDKKQEYKSMKQQQASDDDDEGSDDYNERSVEEDGGDHEDEEGGGGKDASEYGVDHDWFYNGKTDYERIRALSEKQVAELQKKPGNCKHFEKDGMVCSNCEDPETGDHSESCAYSSEPNDKKVAFLSKKSHNYKKPSPIEVEDPENTEDEEETQEEAAVNPPPKGPKPSKALSEADETDYGAYKLAGTNDDVEDYDEPKFAQIVVQPEKKLANDFEIIPSTDFKSQNLNEAFSNFKTKDWSKCNKLMKGDMTCYYCKDAKGAVQEECMFVSASNPKNFKVEHNESTNWDDNKGSSLTTKKPFTKKPTTPTKRPVISARVDTVKTVPVNAEQKERFARLRMGRPLMPTRATVKSTAEPLVTPASILSPFNHDDYKTSANKKMIKRTISYKKKYSDNNDRYQPQESRAIQFESHVRHIE